MDDRMVIASIIGLSVALQLLAAGLAVRLVRVTGLAKAWLFIAASILLMALGRTYAFVHALSTLPNGHSRHLVGEVLALIVSVLMVAGLIRVMPYFRKIASDDEKAGESDARLQEIVDNTESIVYVKDVAGRYLLINQRFEELFDVTREWIRGKSDGDLFPPEVVEAFGANDRRVVQAGTPLQFDEKAPHPDGRIRDYMSTKFPLRRKNNEIYAVCGISTDITDRLAAEKTQRDMEANIVHTQKLESLGVLAGGIAHDFNNLLVPIMASVDLVEMDLGGKSDALENLGAIRDASTRAAELCAQLLAYTGRGHAKVEPIDVSEQVRDSARLLEMSAQAARLRYELKTALPPIKADATQLQQIIMNLVVNAAEAATGTEAEIVIETGIAAMSEQAMRSKYFAGASPPAGDYIFLEVRDNGSGMDEEAMGRMFEPFFTTKFTGRGLGLSSVLGIVRSHGGGVAVQSKPGEGTSVRVMFPVSNESRVPKHGGKSPPPSSGAEHVILVVDDEAMVRKVAKRVLEASGFEVVCVASGKQAIDAYREQLGGFSAVLLDMTMPEMSGEVVFQKLVELDADVRVVLSSGYDESAAREGRRLDGLAGFVQKPYSGQQLVAAIQSAIEST